MNMSLCAHQVPFSEMNPKTFSPFISLFTYFFYDFEVVY